MSHFRITFVERPYIHLTNPGSKRMVKLHDKYFEPFLDAAKIAERVGMIASQINEDYKDRRPLFIAILNGSFIFAADLFKNITIDAEICFIKLASYRGLKSSGPIVTTIGLDVELFNRHLIIVEDIVDTGKTLNAFLNQIRQQQPLSIGIAALLHKPDATIFPLHIDYPGFSIPSQFVVGYGLDYDGLGRNLPEIYSLATE